MRLSDLDHLRCPATRQPLVIEHEAQTSPHHLITGVLRSEDGAYRYSVDQGVPNLLHPIEAGNGADRQIDTLNMFGEEWAEFRRWGWYENYPDVQDAALKYYGGLARDTISAFRSKALLDPNEIRSDEILLDARCGNGRFCKVVSESAATVVGMDAGPAAYAAFENLKDNSRVVIVRGSVFAPPFEENYFDRVYSIGVIQHTGNPDLMVQKMLQVTRRRGTFSLNCYGKGLPSYEGIDWIFRQMLTRLPKRRARAITDKMAALDRMLRRGGPIRQKLRLAVFANMNLLPTEIHMLDWYTPKIAEHYSPKQVLGWFDGRASSIIRSNPEFHHPGYRDWRRRMRHGAMSILVDK